MARVPPESWVEWWTRTMYAPAKAGRGLYDIEERLRLDAEGPNSPAAQAGQQLGGARPGHEAAVMAERRPERISTGQAAAICGVTPKTLRKLAEGGTIPGAAIIGSNWRFDERRLRDWIMRQEAAACRDRGPGTTSTGAAKYGAPAFRFEGETSAAAYERLLGQRRKSA